MLLGVLILYGKGDSCGDIITASFGHPTIPRCQSQRGRCHGQGQEVVEPRHLSLPRTCLLPAPNKALLTLFPLADTMPWTLQLQGAILRTHVLSSYKDLRFIDQTILQGLVSQLGKCLQFCHVVRGHHKHGPASDPWSRYEAHCSLLISITNSQG